MNTSPRQNLLLALLKQEGFSNESIRNVQEAMHLPKYAGWREGAITRGNINQQACDMLLILSQAYPDFAKTPDTPPLELPRLKSGKFNEDLILKIINQTDDMYVSRAAKLYQQATGKKISHPALARLWDLFHEDGLVKKREDAYGRKRQKRQTKEGAKRVKKTRAPGRK